MTKSPSEADRQIGAKVRFRRLMLGLSQQKLAAMLGLTFQQIQKYEKGRNRIGSGRLQEIARALEVPVSYFYEDGPQEVGSSTMTLPGTPYGVRLFRAFEAIDEPELQRKTLEMLEVIATMKA